jgi:hypothetical protein
MLKYERRNYAQCAAWKADGSFPDAPANVPTSLRVVARHVRVISAEQFLPSLGRLAGKVLCFVRLLMVIGGGELVPSHKFMAWRYYEAFP